MFSIAASPNLTTGLKLSYSLPNFYVYDHNRHICIFCPDFFHHTLQLPQHVFTLAQLFIASILMAIQCLTKRASYGRLTTPHDLTRQSLTVFTIVNHTGMNITVHRALPTDGVVYFLKAVSQVWSSSDKEPPRSKQNPAVLKNKP